MFTEKLFLKTWLVGIWLFNVICNQFSKWQYYIQNILIKEYTWSEELMKLHFEAIKDQSSSRNAACMWNAGIDGRNSLQWLPPSSCLAMLNMVVKYLASLQMPSLGQLQGLYFIQQLNSVDVVSVNRSTCRRTKITINSKYPWEASTEKWPYRGVVLPPYIFILNLRILD